MRNLSRMVLLLVVSLASRVEAQSVRVRSAHEAVTVQQGGTQQRLFLLKPDEMLQLRVAGPTNLGLRMRNVVVGTGAIPPIDLTVVRDDQEQGTVRFMFPDSDGAQITGAPERTVSGEVLVKVEVPAGQHGYQVVASGTTLGVLIEPVVGVLAEAAIVATPGKVQPNQGLLAPPKVHKRIRPGVGPVMPRQAEPPPPEVLASVVLATMTSVEVELTTVRVARDDEHQPGPGIRVAGSVTSLLLAGMASLLLSASWLEHCAVQEPVQLAAKDLQDRADLTYRVSFGMGGAALVSAAVMLILHLVEAQDVTATASSSGAGLALRF